MAVHQHTTAWLSFLANEKLTAATVGMYELGQLVDLLCEKGGPRRRPYAKRLESRRLVCMTAIENGIDIAKWKNHGKMAMGRGLLDVWNQCYLETFGGVYGTAGYKEVKRRGIKTKLSNERKVQ